MTAVTSFPSKIGKYRILGELGRGAMGRVLLGKDPVLGRKVAIKVLLPAADQDSRERFLREAKIVGGFFHPNIVVLLEFGFEGEQPYLVMEHLDGENLEVWLRELRDWGQQSKIFLALCRALEHAHQRGILHRDIKPTNVQVLRDGEPKLMDFGIARAPTGGLTATGTILGTPEYLAPEILNDASYSRKSDHYSLALLIYRVLSGRQPFAAKTLQACLTKVLRDTPEPLATLRPDLPGSFCRALTHHLEKEPEERPETLELLASEIARVEDPRESPTRKLAPRAAPRRDLQLRDTQQIESGTTQLATPESLLRPRRDLVSKTVIALILVGGITWWGLRARSETATPTPSPETANARPGTPEVPASMMGSDDSRQERLGPDEATQLDEKDQGVQLEPTQRELHGPEPGPAAPAGEIEILTVKDRAANEAPPDDLEPLASAVPPRQVSPESPRATAPPPARKPITPYPPTSATVSEAGDSGSTSAKQANNPAATRDGAHDNAAKSPAGAEPQALVLDEPASATETGARAIPSSPRIDRANRSVLRRGIPSELILEGSFPSEIASVRLRRGRTDLNGLQIIGLKVESGSRLRMVVVVQGSVTLGRYSLVVLDEAGQASNRWRVEVGL